MIAFVDVGYDDGGATAACVRARDWGDAAPVDEVVARFAGAAAAYEPGALFRRELPFVVGVLARLPAAPAVVVVDGYVWLGAGRPGLGARLHEALGGGAAVVGVAKRAFAGAPAVAVLRGRSARPLYVTAVGVDAGAAAAAVRGMHGAHRIPTLIARADALSRGVIAPSAGRP